MAARGSALPAPIDGARSEISLAGQAAPRPGDVESTIAAQVQDLLAEGNDHGARDLFAQIVSRQQRRASRIAWHYLHDVAEADEAVQDAFVKAYTHIKSFQRNLSFEVWLTRILINGCLDRQKARTRRSRWMMPAADAGRHDQDTIDHSTRDVAEMTGLNESTVRVHLFRAIRKLRTAMEGQRHAI
jgi:RNA polymerase sigma-70 factor (ECF subfamily)